MGGTCCLTKVWKGGDPKNKADRRKKLNAAGLAINTKRHSTRAPVEAGLIKKKGGKTGSFRAPGSVSRRLGLSRKKKDCRLWKVNIMQEKTRGRPRKKNAVCLYF